jgi:signal transduction histidine kinase
MKYLIRLFMAIAAFIAVSIIATIAQERGTPEQAQALCDRAVLHMKEVGPETAIKDFNDQKGEYIDHDLFVIVYDPNATIMTGVPALIGKNARSLTDVAGKEFGKDIIDAAHNNDGSWVEYHMTNPTTKKVELKTSFVRKFGDYVVFVGAYKS